MLNWAKEEARRNRQVRGWPIGRRLTCSQSRFGYSLSLRFLSFIVRWSHPLRHGVNAARLTSRGICTNPSPRSRLRCRSGKAMCSKETPLSNYHESRLRIPLFGGWDQRIYLAAMSRASTSVAHWLYPAAGPAATLGRATSGHAQKKHYRDNRGWGVRRGQAKVASQAYTSLIT